ncbi:sugar efflux transporter [Motilimonas eburnea]|uniref:sugar efflux transporter n=1 Tax=Motilimonas eburnea TaxID=1737488 RepID=UPI001E3CCCB6|nr:sugar efflux transporter [Motilimonas eburnea]MCE2570179.1 sugar efflux transporter [Motilimonas eburnea]
MFKQPVSLGFILSTFICGLTTALVFPLTSLYLINEVGASPMAMSYYLAAMVLSGVMVSLYLAKQSDRGWSRKKILVLAQVGFCLGVLTMALTSDYWLTLASAICFLSFSNAALPQLFTLGRLYADQTMPEQSTQFVSVMRAGIALAWVIGPPIAFMLQASFGFALTFISSATLALMLIGLIIYLPTVNASATKATAEPATAPDSANPTSTEPQMQSNPSTITSNWLKVPGVALFLVSILAMCSANTMYLTALPLYLSQELNTSAQLAGYMMGTAALFEIPIMILAGTLAVKLGNHRLMFMAFVAGVIFYIGMVSLDNPSGLLLIQLFNGIFIAIAACIGLVIIQDMMPKQLGLATTLFNNAQQLSLLLGSLLVGMIAQHFNYYSVFLACLIAMFIALTCFALMQKSLYQRRTQCVPKIA